MSETKKPTLNQRIETIKGQMTALTKAHRDWQFALETQQNTRTHLQNVYRNIAISVGESAGEVLSVLDELMAQLVKANEGARLTHEKYMALKAETEPKKEVKAAPPKDSKFKTGYKAEEQAK